MWRALNKDWDRSKELSAHRLLTNEIGLPVDFAAPKAPGSTAVTSISIAFTNNRCDDRLNTALQVLIDAGNEAGAPHLDDHQGAVR